jgi:hypothetical protein
MNHTTFDDKIRTFNGFTHVKVKMDTPITMDTALEFKSLNLICGMNGAGKSLMNKLTWVAGIFLAGKIAEKVHNISDTKDTKESFQFILNKTFDNQDFNGEFEYHLRDELLSVSFYNVKFQVENGKVTELSWSFPDDVAPCGSVTYLSTYVRDFSNIERYLKIKNMMNIESIRSWDDIEKLCDMFKIYDVLALESIIPKFENAGALLKSIKDTGISAGLMDDFDLVDLEVDKKKGEIYYHNNKNDKIRISTLGAGDQSIIMMLISVL